MAQNMTFWFKPQACRWIVGASIPVGILKDLLKSSLLARPARLRLQFLQGSLDYGLHARCGVEIGRGKRGQSRNSLKRLQSNRTQPGAASAALFACRGGCG